MEEENSDAAATSACKRYKLNEDENECGGGGDEPTILERTSSTAEADVKTDATIVHCDVGNNEHGNLTTAASDDTYALNDASCILAKSKLMQNVDLSANVHAGLSESKDDSCDRVEQSGAMNLDKGFARTDDMNPNVIVLDSDDDAPTEMNEVTTGKKSSAKPCRLRVRNYRRKDVELHSSSSSSSSLNLPENTDKILLPTNLNSDSDENNDGNSDDDAPTEMNEASTGNKSSVKSCRVRVRNFRRKDVELLSSSSSSSSSSLSLSLKDNGSNCIDNASTEMKEVAAGESASTKSSVRNCNDVELSTYPTTSSSVADIEVSGDGEVVDLAAASGSISNMKSSTPDAHANAAILNCDIAKPNKGKNGNSSIDDTDSKLAHKQISNTTDQEQDPLEHDSGLAADDTVGSSASEDASNEQNVPEQVTTSTPRDIVDEPADNNVARNDEISLNAVLDSDDDEMVSEGEEEHANNPNNLFRRFNSRRINVDLSHSSNESFSELSDNGQPLAGFMSSSSLNSSISADNTTEEENDDDDDNTEYPNALPRPRAGDVESRSKEAAREVLMKPKPAYSWNITSDLMYRESGFRGSRARSLRNNTSLDFNARFYASRHVVERMKFSHFLRKHSGCVNCLNFNRTGDLLCSGSDDLCIIVWDWAKSHPIQIIKSGHTGNIFQTKFLDTNGCVVIISASRDGQVRRSVVPPSGGKNVETERLYKHSGAVHKLALTPHSNNEVISVGEDAAIMHFDLRTQDDATQLTLVQKNNKKVRLYSISHHPYAPEFCVSGYDSHVFVYDRRNCAKPVREFYAEGLNEAPNRPQVTCAVYNFNGTEILASYSDECIYLYDNFNFKSGEYLQRYRGHANNRTIKGVNFFGPRSEYVISGSDCGHIFFWEKKTEAIITYMPGDRMGVVNCLEPHPSIPLLATSGLDNSVKIWSPTSETYPPNLTHLERCITRNLRRSALGEVDFDNSQFHYFMRQFFRSGGRQNAHDSSSDSEYGDMQLASDSSSSATYNDHDSDGPPLETLQCRTQ